MKRRLIGFAGRKRCGKSTLAKILQQEENAIIITIADFLKYLCCDLMNISYEELIEKKDNGYTFDVVPDERWFKIISHRTDIGVDDVRKELENKHITSIREMLQVIGTDVIRKYNENWHVQKMIKEIESYSDDRLIVIDDVRFPNEKEAILSRSGEVFFIVRPNILEVSNHSSETSLKWQDFDTNHVILNSNITLEKFALDFLVHFINDFDCRIPKSIFLNENMEFLSCGNFGFNYDKNDELLKDILWQIKNDEFFKDFGIIRYRTYSQELAKRYVEEVDNSVWYLENHSNSFVTYNPLIVENLKLYL